VKNEFSLRGTKNFNSFEKLDKEDIHLPYASALKNGKRDNATSPGYDPERRNAVVSCLACYNVSRSEVIQGHTTPFWQETARTPEHIVIDKDMLPGQP
jgi:hypothetical protein